MLKKVCKLRKLLLVQIDFLPVLNVLLNIDFCVIH